MTNQFSELSAESAESSAAQITFPETETETPETETERYASRLCGWQTWREGMSFLRQIHSEIAPELALIQAAESYATNGRFAD